MRKLTLPMLVCILMLGACAKTTAFTAVAVEKKMQFNDSKARLTLSAACDITIGAFFRLPPSYQRATQALCGGEPMPRPSTLTPKG